MSETILQEAQRVIHGERQHSYGHPIDNHGCTAELWRAYLKRKYGHDIPLTAEDVCFINILQKVSREANRSKRDNWVDICGYAGNVEMIEAARGELTKEEYYGIR